MQDGLITLGGNKMEELEDDWEDKDPFYECWCQSRENRDGYLGRWQCLDCGEWYDDR